MGRVRGKGKKQTVVKASNDVGSETEEKFSASKRRGRSHKPLDDEVEDDEIEEIANGDQNGKTSIATNSLKGRVNAESGRKRKRSSLVKEKSDSINEENGLEVNSVTKGSVKSVGFRQNGSRRKNKPRRAAEVGVGVECK